MKEELMTEVMQHMLSYLDNAQMKQLRQVMEHALCRYNVTELEMKQEDDSNNLIERFIAAKRIEGCSEKNQWQRLNTCRNFLGLTGLMPDGGALCFSGKRLKRDHMTDPDRSR